MTSQEQRTPWLRRCLATLGASLLQFYFNVVELFFPCVMGARCGQLSGFDSCRIGWPIVLVGGPHWRAGRRERNKELLGVWATRARSEAILFYREREMHVRAQLD